MESLTRKAGTVEGGEWFGRKSRKKLHKHPDDCVGREGGEVSGGI